MDFAFGIETEYLLVRRNSFTPLWIHDLDNFELQSLLNKVQSSLPLDGLNQKPLHNSRTHYLIEGYTITDDQMQPKKLLPKGIEVRTPTFGTIAEAVHATETLHDLMNQVLAQVELSSAIISHHPIACDFDAPRNYTKDEYWHWARVATATYGPDFNISVPAELSAKIDRDRLHRRINYYMPAAIALSLASPLFRGQLWRTEPGASEIAKSVRTYRRCDYAPLYYVHTEPSLRFEFKGFEMARDLGDYHSNFLLSLALLLDDAFDRRLPEGSDDTETVELLKSIAQTGLSRDEVRRRAAAVLEAAQRISEHLGYNSTSLATLWQRLDSRRLPADDIIDTFEATASVEETLMTLHGFVNHAPLASDLLLVS